MKILLKLSNVSGNSPIEEFSNVKEAEKYLNEVLYYSGKVELSSSFSDIVEYNNDTRLSHLMSDAINYGEGYINVYPSYE